MSAKGLRTANIEYHNVICFLTLENVSPAEIHRRLTAQYGSPVMSVQAVRKWCRLFKSGRTNVFNEEQEGRPVSVSTNELCVKIDATIKEN